VKKRASINNELPRRYEVVTAGSFRAEFDRILDYISTNWWETSTENFRTAVWRKIHGLDLFPNGYRKWPGTNFRYCLVWDYLIFFQVDEARDRVIVVKIYHAARDLESLLNDKEEK